jgi:crotonobetainyl-CoA:carnitine CoA-transferase CaiB-like acyl-CoA transferase
MTGTPEETPTVPGLPVADFAGGMMTAIAAMVGVYAAERTGEGEYFDLAMTDAIVSWMTLYAPFAFDESTEAPPRGGTMPAGKYPCYNVYDTADGEHVTLGAMEWKFWEATCEELDLPEYANREDHFPTGPRSAEIKAALAERFAERSREEWLDHLDPTEVPVAPVNDAAEVWDDPQVRERGMVASLATDDGDLPMVNTPVRPAGDHEFVRESYPRLGEQSRRLLSDLGLDATTVEELFADGVTAEPDD